MSQKVQTLLRISKIALSSFLYSLLDLWKKTKLSIFQAMIWIVVNFVPYSEHHLNKRALENRIIIHNMNARQANIQIPTGIKCSKAVSSLQVVWYFTGIRYEAILNVSSLVLKLLEHHFGSCDPETPENWPAVSWFHFTVGIWIMNIWIRETSE